MLDWRSVIDEDIVSTKNIIESWKTRYPSSSRRIITETLAITVERTMRWGYSSGMPVIERRLHENILRGMDIDQSCIFGLRGFIEICSARVSSDLQVSVMITQPGVATASVSVVTGNITLARHLSYVPPLSTSTTGRCGVSCVQQGSRVVLKGKQSLSIASAIGSDNGDILEPYFANLSY